MLHKTDATGSAITVDPGLCGVLARHVVLAPPAGQHPFRMFGEPFRGIVFALHQARLERQILDWTLLGAGSRRTLQAKDEHKRGQWLLLSLDGRRTNPAGLAIPITRRSASSCSRWQQDLRTPQTMTTRPLPVPIT